MIFSVLFEMRVWLVESITFFQFNHEWSLWILYYCYFFENLNNGTITQTDLFLSSNFNFLEHTFFLVFIVNGWYYCFSWIDVQHWIGTNNRIFTRLKNPLIKLDYYLQIMLFLSITSLLELNSRTTVYLLKKIYYARKNIFVISFAVFSENIVPFMQKILNF